MTKSPVECPFVERHQRSRLKYLQDQTLLWVHQQGFSRRQTKGRGIEMLRIWQKTPKPAGRRPLDICIDALVHGGQCSRTMHRSRRECDLSFMRCEQTACHGKHLGWCSWPEASGAGISTSHRVNGTDETWSLPALGAGKRAREDDAGRRSLAVQLAMRKKDAMRMCCLMTSPRRPAGTLLQPASCHTVCHAREQQHILIDRWHWQL